MAALDAFGQAHGQIIAQVIKTKLAVSTISDIRPIGFGTINQIQLMQILTRIDLLKIDQESLTAILGTIRHLQHPHAQPQRLIDRGHPARIAAGQIIVDRDQMHPFAGQSVQVNRQGSHQGFAFAGTHLGDLALMQSNAPDHLNIIMAQSNRALAGFTNHGKCFGQQIIQRLALGQTLLKFSCLVA